MKYVCPRCGEASEDASWPRDDVEITREQDHEPVRIIAQRQCPACEAWSSEPELELGAIE